MKTPGCPLGALGHALALAIIVAGCGARTPLAGGNLDAAVTPRDVAFAPDAALTGLPDLFLDASPATICSGMTEPRLGQPARIDVPGREDAVAVYDPASDRVLVLGGYDFGAHRSTDMYAVELASGTTTPLAVTGDPTVVAIQTAVSWDASRGRALIVGGLLSDRPSGATVAVTIAGDTAHVERLGDYPGGEAQGVAAAIDLAGNRLVATGGVGESHLLGATFAMDLASATWETLVDADPAFPPVLNRAMAYDPVARRMLATGGATDDTNSYTLDLTAAPTGWRAVALALDVVPHTTPSLFFSTASCGFVMTTSAGTSTNCAVPTRFFQLDNPAVVYHPGDIDLSTPGRYSPATLFDPIAHRLIFVGGLSCTNDGAVQHALLPSLDVVPLLP